MKWYKAYSNLHRNPKRYRLESELGTDHGLHFIHLWFSYVAEFSKDGDVSHFSIGEVARACEWKGDPQAFWDALSVAGFLDKVKGGPNGFRVIAHDWFEENARFVKENEKRKPTGNPRVTHGKPVLQDKTGQDKYTPEFETFFKAYPIHKGKGKAFDAWQKKKPDLQAVLKTIALLKASDPKWKAGFAQHPTTWLNQDGWLDDPEQAAGLTGIDHVVAMDRRRTAL